MDRQQDDERRDSVGKQHERWMQELPGVDASVESARQRILGIARLLECGLASIAARHELSLGDWEALSALQRSGPPYELSPKELAQALSVTSGTMSVRIERLTHARFVEPAAPRSDGRSRPIRLTAEGSKRWRAATAERTAIEQEAFTDALSAADLKQLNALLGPLLARHEQVSGPAPVHGALRADDR